MVARSPRDTVEPERVTLNFASAEERGDWSVREVAKPPCCDCRGRTAAATPPRTETRFEDTCSPAEVSQSHQIPTTDEHTRQQSVHEDMKITSRHIERDGSGRVTLIPEEE